MIVVDAPAPGVYHATNAGRTSWFGFATEILRLTRAATPVRAIPASEYPTPAARPANSILDNRKLQSAYRVAMPDWRRSLEECLAELQSRV